MHLPRVIKQGPNAPNEYLAYLTKPEMSHLRANPAAPHSERLPDTGALNTYNGVPLFWIDSGYAGPSVGDIGDPEDPRGFVDAPGHAESGAEMYGYSEHGQKDPRDATGFGGGYDDPYGDWGGGDSARDAKPGQKSGPIGPQGGGAGGQEVPRGPTEAEIMAQNIAAAMDKINAFFGGRQGVYDALQRSSYDLSKSGVEDSFNRAQRNLRFQMLRQGLETGQPDIDLRAQMAKVKSDSLAESMRHAQSLSERLRARDEAKRSNLYAMAMSGKLLPGQVGGAAGTLSAGIPSAWSGISNIPWSIPQGYAGPGYSGGTMPTWSDEEPSYFGVLS
jgi:hypothetical protein